MAKMSRRRFISHSAAFVSVLAADGYARQENSGAKPNVLVIHTDQHRLDCLGAYGNRDIATPNIDALAADGVRFTNSFCPYPICTPSRYSLLSGLYVHQHRGWNNHCTLQPGTETFASVLRDAGYKTKAIGKMHFTPTYLDVGFSEMSLAEQNGPGRWDDDYHRDLRKAGLIDFNDLEDQETEWRRNARPEYYDSFGAMPSNLPKQWHSTEWIGARALETVQQWTESRNLLMVGFIKPHHPFDPPAEYCGRHDPAKLTILPGWTDACLPHDIALSRGYFKNDTLTEPALRRVMEHYYFNIEHIDEQVGKIVKALKEKGIYDSTMIVFTSDHGEYLGFHHLLLKGNYMYDPLVKVPLIVKFPGNKDKGAVRDGLVNTTDVAPTIIAQAGCDVPKQMCGLNLAEDRGERKVVFAEANDGKMVMARTRTRKLIIHHAKQTALFYDLEKDPLEIDNRHEDPAYRDDVATLRKAMDDWRPQSSLTKAYLDERAPVIDQPNVPSPDDAHRQEMIEYARLKWDLNRDSHHLFQKAAHHYPAAQRNKW